MIVAVADTSALYAVADASDEQHAATLAVLERGDLDLVIPALVAAEASLLIAARLGPRAESAFLRGLREYPVEAPSAEEWTRIGELAERYADFPLGGIDASVVALAERLDTAVVVTLDRRHFLALRPRHREALELLP